MKVKSVLKVADIHYYVETDEAAFPEYRRNKRGNWEHRMEESWDMCHNDGALEKAFQEYQAGQPNSPLDELAKLVNPLPDIQDGIYHIEYIDYGYIRLTKK